MAKGDKIQIGIRNGSNEVILAEVVAQQNGRNVTSATEKDAGITWLVLQEITRGGTVMHEIKVQLNDVVMAKTTRKEV